MDINFTEIAKHNEEAKAVWEAFRAGKPIRPPVHLGTATQFFIFNDDLNPGEAVTFESYSTDAQTMLDFQLRSQAWRAEKIAPYCDDPIGLPEEFLVKVDLQNYDEAAYFGAPVVFIPNQVPDTKPIFDGERKNAFQDLGLPDPLKGGWYAKAHQIFDEMSERIYNSPTYLGRPIRMTPFGVWTSGPFTLAIALRGGDFLTDLYEDPQYAHDLLDYIVEGSIQRIRAHMKFFGLSAFEPEMFFADDSIQMISTKMLRQFVIPVYRKLIAGVGSPKRIKIHLCGNATRHFKALRDEINVQEFETGFPVDFSKIRQELGPDVLIHGGPNIMLLLNGTPEAVSEETRRILDSGIMAGGRFVLREGNNLAPYTPFANLEAMYETARSWAQYQVVQDMLNGKTIIEKANNLIHTELTCEPMCDAARKLRATYAITPEIPLVKREFGFYSLEAWQEQGMPPDVPLAELFDYDPLGSHFLGQLGWSEAAFEPTYEVKLIEDRGDYEVEQDSAGRHVLYFKGRRQGFMPEYLDHPVKNLKTWEENVKWRLDPKNPQRYADLDERMTEAKAAAANGLMISQGLIGGYMYLRSLIGPEQLLYAFYDMPTVLHACMQTWLELADAIIARHQEYVTLDEIFFAEDICYNHGALISPRMMQNFLFPYYQQLIYNVKSRQIDKARHLYVQVDTDGYAVPIIPLYKEAIGMDVMSPFEVASGCAVVVIGQEYPDLAIFGGIDKRVLAQGRDAIDAHLEYIIPAMQKRGGYIPTCDHGVPPEVSYQDYLYYRKRCVELGG